MFVAFVVLLLSTASCLALETAHILFIGNSLTLTNNLPLDFQDIAKVHGITVRVVSSTYGGATLYDQVTTYGVVALIKSQPWTAVIVQE
jgi:hypothetical protein